MTDEQKYDERIRSFYELYIFPSVKNWRNIVSNLESAAPDYIRGKNEGRLDQWEFLENSLCHQQLRFMKVLEK